MTWGRVDDELWHNGKQLGLSDAAFRVWVCSWSFCASQHPITGFIAEPHVGALLRLLRKRQKVVDELVTARAWEAVRGGYLIHDFEHYVDKGSAERTAQWRQRKRAERRDDGVTGRDVTSTPSRARSRVPVPVPRTEVSPPSAPPRGSRGLEKISGELTRLGLRPGGATDG